MDSVANLREGSQVYGNQDFSNDKKDRLPLINLPKAS